MIGLSTEQIASRRGWIGGSDAAKIMKGEWYDLWLVKTGRAEPEDLSGVLAVQLGLHTEALNLSWFERQTGLAVSWRGLEKAHPYYGFMRCTLDGFVESAQAVVQAKWCNPWSKIEQIEQRYMPQVHHEMLVCGAQMAFLSVITGKPEYHCIEIRRDAEYASRLLQQEEDFWSWVEADEPPPDAPTIEAPTRPAVYRTVSMETSNAWAEYAGIWRETIGPSRRCSKAAEELRALVESDIGEASGHGVKIVRSKDGKLLIREL